MANCNQYNNDYVNSIKIKNLDIDISFVEDIINKDNADYLGDDPIKVTGVWYPIVIKKSDNEAEYCDLLQKSKKTNDELNRYYSRTYGKDKCQSSDIGLFDVLDISDNLVATKSRFFDGEDVEYVYNALDCSYCGSHTQAWKLIDQQGNESDEYEADCCGGACDVRMNENDYMPKIPLLNHYYYTEPCDFAYISENPARSGPGLGKEAVITTTYIDGLTFTGDAKLYIDWKLKETISEIPYDETTTQHANKYLHNKSYKRSQITSKTCGNFLLTGVNQNTKYPDYDYSWLEDNADSVPKPESFTKPYGIMGSAIDNIFVGEEKVGSFWKWNYTSGILGWYRKYDVNRSSDKRPIPGYDLYIANGDVFFATNAKIEPDPPADTSDPTTDPPFINPCPSGLKIVQNGSNFRGIIPNESSFMYISANIYDLFYEWYQRYQTAGHSISESRRLAAIMATAPQFENVTTDLLNPKLGSKDSPFYDQDSLEQIKPLSEQLQTGTNYDSVRINYVTNKKDLFSILEYKYGAYIGIKGSDSTIKINSPTDDNFVLDLNFDLVTKSSATPGYRQIIEAGNIELLNASRTILSLNGITYYPKDSSNQLYDIYPRIVDSSTHDDDNKTYCGDCDAYSSFYLTDDGEAACIEDGEESFCYQTLSFFLNNSQGPDYATSDDDGTRPERYISDATLRENRSVFVHPYIDTFAINSKKSMYVSSALYDVPIGVTHPDSKECPKNSTLALRFVTSNDNMIKLYWSTLNAVQNTQCVSNERFPLDLDNLCKCYTNNGYVPNVSTKISPVLKKYGGYTQAYLDSIFGQGAIEAGGTVGICRRSDPLALNDCVYEASVGIPNYVHSIWDIEVNANLISVDENINTNVSPWKLDTSVNYVKYNPRQEWKRFATKVKIESKSSSSEVSLYSEQTRGMPSDPQNQGYKITLTNPFLTGLIGDEQYIEDINMPEKVNCTNYQGLSGLTDIRGDEISIVNLTFTNQPQKTYLNFYFENMQFNHDSTLSSCQFHPNKGLMDEDTTFDPIIAGSIFDYDRELNKPQEGDEEDTEEQEEADIFLYYGDINANFQTIFNNLTEFNLNKKVKIYTSGVNPAGDEINIGLPLNNEEGFFEHHGHKFAGNPSIFEYLKTEQESSLYPSVLPSISKTHTWFNCLLNEGKYYPFLPDSPVFHRTNDPQEIVLEGSRYYFKIFPKIYTATLAIEKLDEDGNFSWQSVANLGEFISAENGRGYYLENQSFANGNLPSQSFDVISSRNYFIKIGNKYYKYKGGSENIISNYLEIDQFDMKFFSLYNDTQIDLQDMEETGYVYNSSIECDTYATDNQDIKIISKSLKWSFYDKNNRPTSKNKAVTSKLNTHFFLDKALGSNKSISLGSDTTSFLIYSEKPGVSQESSVYINNDNFKTKWGDVIGYDGPLLDEFVNSQKSLIDLILVSPYYENWFYKHFINFLARTAGENLFFASDRIYNLGAVDILGTVLQKYNLFNGPYNENISWQNIQNYQNFIPILDITIDSQPGFRNNGSLSFTTSSLNTPYIHPGAIDPENQFWIKISKDSSLTTSYIPQEEYSPTLRIDGPFNQLYQTRKSFNYDDSGYRDRFLPSLHTLSPWPDLIGSIVSDPSHEYFQHDIVYGDKDRPKCEAQVNEDKRGLCLLENIGTGFLFADYIYSTQHNAYQNLDMDGKKYYFSYDCGEYNPIGLPHLISIKKSKLPYDILDSRPFDDLPHINDARYQSELDAYVVDNDPQDDNANEILFRILHGEKESINRSFFGGSPIQPLNKIDLIDYSDPEITPRDIYDQILFNYDKDVDFSNFIFDATISVEDTLDIGFEYILKINNKELKINIQENYNNEIEALVSFKNRDYKLTLFQRESINQSYISVEAGGQAPSPANNNTTIRKVRTIEHLPARMIAPVGKRYRTGNVAIRGKDVFKHGMYINCEDIDPSTIGGRQFESWDNNYETVGSPFENRNYGLGGGKTKYINYDNVVSVSVNNLLGAGEGMQAKLNLVPGPWRWSERKTSTESPSPPPDPELSYGYCRRTLNCNEPDPEDSSQSIKENFLYEYEIGHHKFDLYGHVYLHTPLPGTNTNNNSNSSSSVCFDSTLFFSTNCGQVDYSNAAAGTTPYGNVYYQMQSTRPIGESEYGIDGPLDGIDVRGDFVNCYEPREGMDLEPECVPFSDDTKWGLGYAIWKPRFGFYLPYGEIWATGMLHLRTMDSSTDEFWDYWQEIEGYKESSNPYQFNKSICADDTSLDFFKSMQFSPVIIGNDGLTQEIKQDLLDQFSDYEYQIAQWLVDNGTTKADKGTAMNYGNEGVDYCGYVDEKVEIPDVDLYYKKETVYHTYDPEPETVDIRITQSQITITIQGQTICIDNSLSRCPKIDWPQTPGSTYIINDSGCDKCDNSPLKIKTLTKTPGFKTITETRTHVIASMEGTDLNDAFHGIHFVGHVNQSYPPPYQRYYDIGDGWFDVVCGQTPGNPWYSHRDIIAKDGMGTFDTRASIWKQNITNLFNEDDYADTQVVDKALMRRDTISNLGSTILDIARIRRTDRANRGIQEADIIHGVVPDSISNISISVQDQNYTKFRRSGHNGVTTGQGVYKTYTASVTYKYVRPYTIKDAIKESRLGVTDDSFVNQAFDLDFPLWYGLWVGNSAANEIILNSPSTRNFIVIEEQFILNDKFTGCKNFVCNYDNAKIVPCPPEDHYCWSISSWNGVR